MGFLMSRASVPGNGVGPFQGIQVQTSVSTVGIPIVYGLARVSPNLIWYGDFTSSGGGGKGGKGGGGGKGAGAQTNYAASIIMGICEGPITSLVSVWINKKNETAAAAGFTVFTGTSSQAPWGYMTTNHPTQARTYPNTAYVAASKYTLDSGAQLPNHTFEICGGLPFTPAAGTILSASPAALWLSTTAYVTGANVYGPTGGTFTCISANTNQQPPNNTYWTQITPDSNPGAFIPDLLENVSYGPSFPSAYMGDMTQFSSYCVANGLFLSPKIDGQEAASSIMQHLMEITNSEMFWSDGLLKIVPRGDTVVTGNGVTFTPNLTPIFNLTDDNFISSATPVSLAIADVVDAFNIVTVNFSNRANAYNQQPIQVKDQVSIDLYGMRPEGAQSHTEICDPAIAQTSAQLRLQRIQSTRNVYTFELPITFCMLEPMDLVTLTDVNLGLNLTTVRITSIDEDEYGNLKFTAEEMFIGAAHPALFNNASVLGYAANYNAPPPNTNAPVFYTPSSEVAGNKLVGYLMASGGADWGGCDVWVSSDNTTYALAGRITGGSRMGVLTAALGANPDPDLTDTLSVDLTESLGTMESVTQNDADQNHTLCYVDGELISYETATLTSSNHYSLTYLRRGRYGSPITSHAIGSQFVRMDGSQFDIDFTAVQIGKPFYVKLPAFNLWEAGLQDLSTVSSYSFTAIAPPLPSTAQPFAATVGLPAPSSVQAFASTDANGIVSQVKVQFKLAVTENLVPDGFALCVSVSDYANQLGIGTDSGATLTIDNAHVLASGSNYTIESGSTTGYIEVATAANPLPTSINLGGQFWAQYGTSQWRKVTSYDTLGFYFNEPFDVAPTVGLALNWVEITWTDERDSEYRLAAIVSGSQYEIVKWTTLTETSGVFSVGGLTRAQEGTTQINGSGGTLNYYPAPGNGTRIIAFPSSSVTQNPDGTWTAESSTDITVPAGSSVAISALTWRNTTAGLLRSPIVPATYGGPL